MIRTAARRLCGHLAGGPTGVFDQSVAAMRAAIRPPRSNTESISAIYRFLCMPLISNPKKALALWIIAAWHVAFNPAGNSPAKTNVQDTQSPVNFGYDAVFRPTHSIAGA